MKLLQLNVSVNYGSTGKIAEEIGQVAINHGWESIIAYGRSANSSISKLIKVGHNLDVYLHYAKNYLFDREGLGSRKPTLELIKHIKHLSPDIIHLHNIHDHWLNYPLLFEYFSSINTPIVWTFHDCWAFTGGCAYFDVPPCDKWKTRCSLCPQKKNKIDCSEIQFKKRVELIASLSNRITIVPVSGWLANFTKQSILKKCRIQLIHNGIDTNSFKICVQKNVKPLILGIAFVWDSRKGLNDFVKLREIIPENKADIVLIGLTDKQIKVLPNGIIGRNKTQNIEELINLYNQASVLVNPTYADNFPTVNLEALACGTPVITYRTGGSPEAIDESTGLVVEKGDIDSLAKGIMEIINHPEKYSRENCRKRAELQFNKDTQFDKYIDLYEEILSKTK